jgi:hypothetical protein
MGPIISGLSFNLLIIAGVNLPGDGIHKIPILGCVVIYDLLYKRAIWILLRCSMFNHNKNGSNEQQRGQFLLRFRL